MSRKRAVGAKILHFPAALLDVATLNDAAALDARAVIEQVRMRMDKLREYAEQVARMEPGGSAIHPRHAANGIRKIANEISRAKESKR